jgi:nucleotide-sensitive chloride channel 1A
MQLELEAEPSEYDEEPELIELTVLPPTSALSPDTTAGPIQTLFEAVSNCSNLHPDPISQDEEMEDIDDRIMFESNIGHEGISGLPGVARGTNDGGLPPPFPGSGGWITAENVGEYFDEYGNWIGGAEGDGEGEPLGEGAGRVRGRDEVEGADEATLSDVNGHGRTEEEDHKRPRVD